MIDLQSSGRRWGWPALALLSLAALLAGAWWLASVRPGPTVGVLQPEASHPPAHRAGPVRAQPHPASLEPGTASRRRAPRQREAGAVPSVKSVELHRAPQQGATEAAWLEGRPPLRLAEASSAPA